MMLPHIIKAAIDSEIFFLFNMITSRKHFLVMHCDAETCAYERKKTSFSVNWLSYALHRHLDPLALRPTLSYSLPLSLESSVRKSQTNTKTIKHAKNIFGQLAVKCPTQAIKPRILRPGGLFFLYRKNQIKVCPFN
jgi:hypothetical protein